ncbi:MAG: hypothetical protein R3185_08040, partial [Candidatus Thermoplasmatota archaeon]|nr:hypothetical protein [Candidatus Thermoplasmatota archaeon]
MNKTIITLIVGIATMLAVPAGVAGDGYSSWIYEQNAEPNVPGWDEDATRMWQGPNQEAKDRIYFDAIIDTWFAPYTPHANPEGFAVRNYGFELFHAYLGVWRDCNGDGFIGDSVTGKHSSPV